MSAKRALIIIQSLKNQTVIADKCVVVERFLDRLIGLMGKAELRPGEGMFFPRCNSIHMWFMRIPIDVLFTTSEKNSSGKSIEKVIAAHSDVRPWRFLPIGSWSAANTIELPVGTIRTHSIQKGDELCIN
jgi:uncharacterized membrane protein (UPF0127 family)